MTNKLPPIPVGDRFADVKAFRALGKGGGANLYECWEDAIRSYGQACWEAAIEAAVYWCDEVPTPKFKHGGSVYDDTELLRQRIASAIRSMKEPQ